MKLSNFEIVNARTRWGVTESVIATVEVTTGILRWKRTEVRQIGREIGIPWHFMDTGEVAPHIQIQQLARVYKLRTGKGL